MTEQNNQENAKSGSAAGFHADFNALPLEEKFSHLLQMEIATLNETFKCVADAAMKVFENVSEAIGDFGAKVENEAKRATEADVEYAAPESVEVNPAHQPETAADTKPPVQGS